MNNDPQDKVSMPEPATGCAVLTTDSDVPALRQDRDRIYSATSEIADRGELTAPVSLDDLLAVARKLLDAEGLSEQYTRYTAVILSNALWRKSVANIPYNRRLLLIPQCLRDFQSCPASIDEYGLACQRCGRCSIGQLVEEAEGLGYVCLVTEGTAIVMSLIASGKVESVIGVGCLESLEAVFPYMELGAIPGLAIPLLLSGCQDTWVDIDRLLEAIHLSDDASNVIVNTESLRLAMDDWFSSESLAELISDRSQRVVEIGVDWLQAGGKLWRPLLVACVHEALCPSTDGLPDYLRAVAVAVECFHKASLIHDDIEDDDNERYGRNTVHAEHGVPVAINVGDYLVGEGYRLLASAGLPPEISAAMCDAAANAHRRLCIGQGEELGLRGQGCPSVEKVIEISRLKTAPAFEVALKLGAIAAGRGDEFSKAIETFSDAVGIAYQIRDDINDDSDLGSGNIIESLANEYPEEDAAGIKRRAEGMMTHYEGVASAGIALIKEPGLKILLHQIMAKIFLRQMECCNDLDRRNDSSS